MRRLVLPALVTLLAPDLHALEPLEVASQQEVVSEGGTGRALLFVPMRGLVRGLPTGLALCGEGIETYRQIEIAGALGGFAVRRSGDCLRFNQVVVNGAEATLTVQLAADRYRIPLQVQAHVAYPGTHFTVLRTDAERFVTITFDRGTPASSSAALVCSNGPEVRGMQTRPHGTEQPFQPLRVSRASRFCSRIEAFPWQTGYWESQLALSDGERLTYTTRVD